MKHVAVIKEGAYGVYMVKVHSWHGNQPNIHMSILHQLVTTGKEPTVTASNGYMFTCKYPHSEEEVVELEARISKLKVG